MFAARKIMRAYPSGDGDGTEFTITEATEGIYTGYVDGTVSAPPTSIGSVTPALVTDGNELRGAFFASFLPTFHIYIEGDHTETGYLEQVEIVGHETLTVADDLLSYAEVSDQSEWNFNCAAVHWDGSGTSDIILTFS